MNQLLRACDQRRSICSASLRFAAAIAATVAAACGSGQSSTGDLGVAPDGSQGDTPASADGADGRFSFFVASLAGMQRLSGSQAGFGGDLRFGKPDGLSGADEICRQIAESAMAGAGAKGWRAFLSVTRGPDGNPVHAIDRVGEGPWYDRRGRLVALTRADLEQTRPRGADAIIANDLPNEDGIPNHAPDLTLVDNHDILTGSDDAGRLYSMDWSHTCHDWTSAVGSDGQPRVGHSWTRAGGVTGGGPPRGGGDFPDGGPPFVVGPRDGDVTVLPDGGPPRGGGELGDGGMILRCNSPGGVAGSSPPDGNTCMGDGGGGESWISTLDEAGCAPGVDLVEKGPPDPRNPTVGSGGGYGAIYCLALTP